jgi:hypothetical protein
MVAAAAPPSPIPAAALTLPVLLAWGMDISRYVLTFLSLTDQRFLFNTGRQLADMKKHLLFLKLTKVQSRIFYAQPSFRSLLETLVHDPSQQLCLRFNNSAGITDVSCLGDVHALTFYDCRGITDVSALGGVHTLNH